MADISNLVIRIVAQGQEQAIAAINQVGTAGAAVSSKPVQMKFDLKGAEETIAVMNRMKAAGMSGGIYNVKVSNAAESIAASKQINAAMAQLGDTTSKVSVGIGKVGQEIKNLEKVGSGSFLSLSNRITHVIDGLLRMARVVASVAVVYFLFRGAINIFKGLLDIVDDVNISMISIAASLTDMAKEGQGPTEELYRRNKASAKDMYAAITLEAAKHFSTSQEMMTTYNRLVQSGYAVRMDEVEALGVLTDKVKLATKGQGVERQLNTEIMALMEGQARAGSLLALELKSRLGPEWKKIVDDQKRAGTLLSFLASMYPGIVAASRDIENTMASQYATTQSWLRLIVAGGLAGMYESVVESLKDMNTYLREHKDDLVAKLLVGWIEIKYAVRDVIGYYQALLDAKDRLMKPSEDGGYKNLIPSDLSMDMIRKSVPGLNLVPTKEGIEGFTDFIKLLNEAIELVKEFGRLLGATFRFFIFGDTTALVEAEKLVTTIESKVTRAYTWVLNIGGNLIDGLMKIIGLSNQLPFIGGVGSDKQPVERKLTTPGDAKTAETRRVLLAAKDEYEIRLPGSSVVSTVKYSELPQTESKPRPMTPEKNKGAGAADAERQRLNSLFDSLTKDIARLSEGKLSEIEANYQKTVEQIYKKTSDRAVTAAEVEVLAKKRATLQKEHLQDEFDLKMAKGSGDVFASLREQYDKDLRDYNGLANAKARLDEYYGRLRTIETIKRSNEILDLQKTYLDSLASESPLLTEQLGLKEQSLEIENKMAIAKVEQLVNEKPYLAHMKEQLIYQQEMVNQAKKYTQERAKWETEGFIGGAKLYGIERINEAAKRGATEFKNAMNTLEATLGDTLGNVFMDTLTGKKTDLKAMFEDLLGDTVKSLFKSGVARGFDLIGDLLSPEKGGKEKGVGSLLGGLLGGSKVLGSSDSNPMYVVVVGTGMATLGSAIPESKFDRTVKKAGKTAYAMRGGDRDWDDQLKDAKKYDKFIDKMYKGERKDLGGIQKLQERFIKDDIRDLNTYGQMMDELIDKNQEMFSSENLFQYQDDFTNVTTGVTSIWSLAQLAMTAAGAEGEAARYGTMVQYGIQGVKLLYAIVAENRLAKAWAAGAAAYSSTWEFLGFPAAVVVAPIMAAVAFAGTLAAGSMGGGGGGIEPGSFNSSLMEMHKGGVVGYSVAHEGLMVDERLIKAQVGEGIIKRDTMQEYARRGISFDMLNRGMVGGAGGGTVQNYNVSVSHSPTYLYRATESDYKRDAKKIVKAINQEIGRRGKGI